MITINISCGDDGNNQNTYHYRFKGQSDGQVVFSSILYMSQFLN